MYFFHLRWPVFHEDNHLLVVYKPAGLLMQRGPAGKPDLIELAKAWLKARHSRPGQVFAGLVHRLDAPVAGVVVVARTSKAAGRLSSQFRDNRVGKTYLAVVHGRPRQQTERLEHFLVRDGRCSRVARPAVTGAQAAALTYKLLDHHASYSLLLVELETGRRHQIRSQLASIGLPILGDRTYGSPRALQHGRIALLARRIAFCHPTLKTEMEFECPLPEGWPWPHSVVEGLPPLWTLEEYLERGLRL